MKKTILALLVVLLLGTFVACDGEADFLLWDNEPAGPKTLKLKLDFDGFSFEGGDDFVGEIELDVDDSVETWADLIEQSFEIPMYQAWSGGYIECPVEWNNISGYVELNGSGFGIYVEKPEGGEYVSIAKTEEIDFDSQFLLTFDS